MVIKESNEENNQSFKQLNHIIYNYGHESYTSYADTGQETITILMHL